MCDKVQTKRSILNRGRQIIVEGREIKSRRGEKIVKEVDLSWQHDLDRMQRHRLIFVHCTSGCSVQQHPDLKSDALSKALVVLFCYYFYFFFFFFFCYPEPAIARGYIIVLTGSHRIKSAKKRINSSIPIQESTVKNDEWNGTSPHTIWPKQLNSGFQSIIFNLWKFSASTWRWSNEQDWFNVWKTSSPSFFAVKIQLLNKKWIKIMTKHIAMLVFRDKAMEKKMVHGGRASTRKYGYSRIKLYTSVGYSSSSSSKRFSVSKSLKIT